jgi:sterol 3beta-glucosyltransferase
MERSMRILLMTAGSRGDVDPFVAFGRRAQRDGHAVRLGVTRDFVATAEAAGIDVAPLDGDYQALVKAQGVSAMAAMKAYRSTIAPMMASILRSAARAALDYRPDVIVYHPKILSADLAAAHLGVPSVLVETVPVVTPTREFPAPGVVGRDLGPLNRLTYKAGAAAGGMFGGVLKEIRAELALPAKGALPGHVRSLVIVSPSLLERPRDWPETTVITGQLYEHADDASAEGKPAADAEMDDFLAEGDVLYAGFGSMASGDAAARGRVIIEAARSSGKRTVVATGWGGIAVADDLRGRDVLVRREIDHASVLPRCVAAIHHGGAGTTHAVVRAGVPSIVVPFLADQPFWGRLLARAGLGSAPIRASRLTVERLTTALDGLAPREAIAPVAARMRSDDGCGSALAVLAEVA